MEHSNENEENYTESVRPGSEKTEHQQIIKQGMEEALHNRKKNIDKNYKGSNKGEEHERSSQPKLEADHEADVLKSKK